jgi:hypothetical protein
VVLFFVAGFLIGFVPGHRRAEQLRAANELLQRTNRTLQQSLRIAELRGALGLMQHRVTQNKFGGAAEIASGFFNGVRQALNSAEETVLRDNLRTMLLQRDEITKGLAQADPGVKQRIERLYAQFFNIRKPRGEG